MEFVENNPDKPWNWKSLTCSPNITIDYMAAYNNPDKPWDWKSIYNL